MRFRQMVLHYNRQMLMRSQYIRHLKSLIRMHESAVTILKAGEAAQKRNLLATVSEPAVAEVKGHLENIKSLLTQGGNR